jgi:CRISPR-associated endonuclease/helicase Cas3
MQRLADKEQKSAIENRTVLLPPSVGGLTERGMLDGGSLRATDIADETTDERGRPLRQRIWDDAAVPRGLRVVRIIDTKPDVEGVDSEEGEAPRKLWLWCDWPREGGRAASGPIAWDMHVDHVVERAKQTIAGLTPSLPAEIASAVIVAAQLHDHGKRRRPFQLTLGNGAFPHVVLAKSNGRVAGRFVEPFRHEFASVFDAGSDPEFAKLGPDMRDLVLHLIAAHHGRARPHFNPDVAFDPDRPSGDAEKLRLETPRRFARLQKKYGRWGLAYLESLLRAADWAASATEAEAAP